MSHSPHKLTHMKQTLLIAPLLLCAFLMISSNPMESDKVLGSGWVSSGNVENMIERYPESLLARRSNHNIPGQKGVVNVYALTYLDLPYPYHYANGAIYDLNTTMPVGGTRIWVDSVEVSSANGGFVGSPQGSTDPELRNHYGRDWFGKTVRVRIVSADGQQEVDTSLYVPNELVVEGNFQENGFLQTGDEISWEPDASCETVLLYAVVFPSQSGANDGGVFVKEIVNNGLFTVTNEDLKDLPSEQKIIFSILQGNFQTVVGAHSGEVYALSGYTEVHADLMKK